MEGLEDVKRELEAKRQALLQELDSAMGKVAALEKDMKRVDDAIRALTKGKTRGRRKTPARAAGDAPPGPSAATPGAPTFDPFAP